MEYVLWLDEIGKEHTEQVGAKAATLGELARSGFPVPEGFVLTVAAFEAANEQAHGPPGIENMSLPADIERALRTNLERLGAGPLAVRSSAVAEDLVDASFAGQYETVLGVTGIGPVARAARRCWGSCFSPRVAEYRRAKGITEPPRMAVLVQRLVSAEAAGVAFTANPISGDRSEVVVNAVRGLGAGLVSGEVTPDQWVIRGDDPKRVSAPEGAIDARMALAVAALARRVERHLGSPQDIEWAISEGTVYLVQARPITALPAEPSKSPPVPAEVPKEGFWQREASHFPEPLYPMTRSVFLGPEGGMSAAFRQVNSDFGLLIDRMEMLEIGGWVYQRLVPLGGKDRRPPPGWLMWLMARTAPTVRNRLKNAAVALRDDLAGEYIRRWHEEWRPGLKQRSGAFRSVDLRHLTNEELDRHLESLLQFVRECWDIHLKVHGGLMVAIAELACACRELLGWDDRHMLDLLAGLSEKSSEPSRRLARLAQLARERPAVAEMLAGTSGADPRRLLEADGEFASAFGRYLAEFGCRALRYEVAEPTLEESPELVLRLLRDQIVRGHNPDAAAAALEQQRHDTDARARTALTGRSTRDRERFERALARAEQAYPAREDSEFYTASAPLALLRYALLEIGRRIAERGQIASTDDVFFLELDEAREALRHKNDKSGVVERRKAERAWVKVQPGPASYGKAPGSPPSFDALPPEARFMHRALMWNHERIFASPLAPGREVPRQVAGIPASAGTYTGPVRVVMGEAEFHKVRPGDVLVCPITSPVWSLLFPSVGALVTDTGGVLSHSAIIAREYRIPAVVGTKNATARFRDDQTVTVDGGSGNVHF